MHLETEPQRNAEYRRAASHGLDFITSPNGSGQSMGNTRAAALGEEFCLLTLVDLPDEFDARAIDEWQYIVSEIVFIDLVDFGRDLQRMRWRHRAILICAVRTLFRRNSRPRKAR